jgi:hypothetical protein
MKTPLVTAIWAELSIEQNSEITFAAAASAKLLAHDYGCQLSAHERRPILELLFRRLRFRIILITLARESLSKQFGRPS